jgi:hypothetical protein
MFPSSFACIGTLSAGVLINWVFRKYAHLPTGAVLLGDITQMRSTPPQAKLYIYTSGLPLDGCRGVLQTHLCLQEHLTPPNRDMEFYLAATVFKGLLAMSAKAHNAVVNRA